IIHTLKGNLSTGMRKCPAHDDSTPSLHVSNGRNGRPVVKCHAGCSQEAVIDQLKRKGVWSNAYERQIRLYTNSHDEADEMHTRLREAWSFLYVALKAEAGQPAEYLQGRGINIMPRCAMILPAKDLFRLLGNNFPAMVCIVTDGSSL